jgi:hypothetical protein
MNTTLREQVLAGLRQGPISLQDAVRNGLPFVRALAAMTKRKTSGVKFEGGRYVLVFG